MSQTIENQNLAAEYFRPERGAFWQWSAGLRFVEYCDGTTLCFREELVSWLRHLEDLEIPPLGVVLAIAGASRSNFSESVLAKYPVFPEDATFRLQQDGEHDAAIAFLKMVSNLPGDLRTGNGFLHLLRTCTTVLDDGYAGQGNMMLAFAQGELDHLILGSPFADPENNGEWTWECLTELYNYFGSLETLTNTLRTSLREPPQPAEVPIPPATLPPEPASLLDELLQDPRTAGVSQLARQLIAALHIPLRSRGANDMPLGGVSDISNRGKLDRLLLSELAAPDDLLMARLANDEALYLRREEPPVRVERERVVLVDTSLRLWGIPRAYAVAAALACAERNPLGNGLAAYAIGGKGFHAADLRSREGILKLMERLDAGLHAGDSLPNCLAALPKGEKEVILVTAHELLADAGFAAALSPVLTKLNFIVAVSRSGEMTLYELLGGNRKVIGEAKLDIMDLLFNFPRFIQRNPKPVFKELPAFFSEDPSPLHFPATSIRLRPFNCKVLSEQSIFVITENGRGLLWQSRDHGAKELFRGLNTRTTPQIHFLGNRYFILAFGRDMQDRVEYAIYDLETSIRRQLVVENAAWWKPIACINGQFHYLAAENGLYKHWVYDIAADVTRPAEGNESIIHANDLGKMPVSPIRHNELKEVINPGYSILQNVKYLRLEEGPYLSADGRSLFVEDDQLVWKFSSRTSLYQTWSKASTIVDLPNEAGQAATLSMRVARWPSGTQAFCDPRGLLHLKPGKPGLPEVTIVMALDQPTAAWASDGACAGNPYFLGANNPGRMSARLFVERYLNLILHTIIDTK